MVQVIAKVQTWLVGAPGSTNGPIRDLPISRAGTWLQQGRGRPLVALLLGVLLANRAWSAPSTQPSVSEVLSRAAHLTESGQHDSALQLLKAAYASESSNEQFAIALSNAYSKQRNLTWAMRVLARHLEAHEDACEVRYALVWVELQQGQTESARQLLDSTGCHSPPEILARGQLLLAYLEGLQDHGDRAGELVEAARSSPRLFEEDQVLLANVTAATQPDRIPTVTGVVDLANGWTSQGLAGSPVDPATRQGSGTAISVVDARIRIMARSSGSVRPLAEGQLRLQQLWSNRTSDLSFRTGTGRFGVLLGKEAPRLQALASLDATQTQGGDRFVEGPMWFSEAQRGELELELPSSVFLMAGAGHRRFRELGRTRTEIDGAVGWLVQRSPRVRFVSAIAARYHAARSEAFDLLGLTAMSQVRLSLLENWETGATVSVSVDDYCRSSGSFAPSDPTTRRDVQWRTTLALFSPTFAQLRVVGRYELTTRASSVADWEYSDHRMLAALEWRVDSDRLGRTLVPKNGRVAADYESLAQIDDMTGLQIRELMRQEDLQRRSSTCLR